jgi:hypothetical protein
VWLATSSELEKKICMSRPGGRRNGGSQVPRDVEDLLLKIESVKKDPDLFELQQACMQLQERVKGPGLLAGRDTTKTMSALVNALKTYSNKGVLLTSLLAAVLTLSRDSSPNRNTFAKEAGVDALLNIMSKNADNSELQAASCSLVSVLREEMLALPGRTTRAIVRAIVSCMEAHLQDYAVASQGVSALRSLRAEMKAGVVNDGIKITVKAMRIHADKDTLQLHACMLLAVLAGEGHENIACLWAEDALSTLLSGMDMLSRSPTDTFEAHQIPAEIFFENTCAAIERMYTVPQAKMEPSLAVLSRILVKYAPSQKIVAYVSQAYMEVAKFEANRPILGRQAVRALLLAADKHKDKEFILTISLVALFGIMQGGDSNIMLVCEPSTFRLFMRQWDTYMQYVDCRNTACSVMYLLVSTSDLQVQDDMIEAGCIRSVAKTLRLSMCSDPSDVVMLYKSLINFLQKRIARTCEEPHDLPAQPLQSLLQRMCDEGAMEGFLIAMSDLKRQIKDLLDILQGVSLLFASCSIEPQAFYVRSIEPLIETILYCADTRYKSGKESDILETLETAVTVLEGVLSLARNLETWRSFQEEFAKCRGFRAILLCLDVCCTEEHKGMEPVCGVARDGKMVTWQVLPMSILRILIIVTTANQANKSKCFKEPGFMDSMLTFMSKHEDNSDVQACACATLGVILEGHEDRLRLLISKGGMARLRHASRLCQQDGKVHESVRCLQNQFSAVFGSYDECGDIEQASTNGDVASSMETLRLGDGDGDGDEKHNKGAKSVGKLKSKSVEVCVACGRSAADVGAKKLLKCSACTIAPMYCSAECQKACWGAHKAECKANRN